MPGYNGSGVYVRFHNFTEDAANDINIVASRMDTEMDGIATALSNCITADGQTTITEDIPFNDKSATNILVKASVGSATTPSLSFVGDTDTGLYRSDANTIGFATDGTERMTLSTTALDLNVAVGLANGTATVPALWFTSDTDTGIYRADADTIGFATGGAERMTITDDSVTSEVEITAPSYTTANASRTVILGNGALCLPVYSDTEIEDKDHPLNTTYKVKDAIIMRAIPATANETMLLRANGPLPTSDWRDLFDVNVSLEPS